DVERAKVGLPGSDHPSPRDALHVVVMERYGVKRVPSVDRPFGGAPGVRWLVHACRPESLGSGLEPGGSPGVAFSPRTPPGHVRFFPARRSAVDEPSTSVPSRPTAFRHGRGAARGAPGDVSIR